MEKITQRRPRIVLLADFPAWQLSGKLPQQKGHYAVWLMPLCQALGEQDEFDIHWITLSKELPSPLHFESCGQQFHVLPRAKKTIGLYSFYWHDRRAIARELKRLAPQLVHSWGTEDCYGLAACDFAGKRLHSVQGLLKAYLQRGPMSPFERRHSFYEPKVLRSVDYLTTESPWARERVQEIAPRQHPLLWEYAVEDFFFDVERQPDERPTALFAGSNVPIKNLPTLLRAFSSPELADVHLLLAGIPPSDFPTLPPNIHPLGRVGRQEMASLLSRTWCLVHPSLADTGPTIAKEARVMGVPLVISTECGSKQYVEEGKSGYVIPPCDTDALIRSVLKCTSSQETSLNMGQYGREACRKALDKQTMASTLMGIYRQILSC